MDVDTARRIATQAHAGQVDKSGAPYIQHPARVAARLTDPAEQAAAWLHDVVEDTGLTLDHLRAAGFPEVVVIAVDLLTRRDGQDPEDYYRAIAVHPVARAVKLADIADNTDPDRVARLDPATAARLAQKYAHAREMLGA